jgi:hypothetical protein
MEWVQGAEHMSSAWVMQFLAEREVTDKKLFSKFNNVGKVAK